MTTGKPDICYKMNSHTLWSSEELAWKKNKTRIIPISTKISIVALTFTNMYNIFDCYASALAKIRSGLTVVVPFRFFSFGLLYSFIPFSFICISLYDSDIYGRIDNSYIIVDDAENDDDVNVHHFFYSTPKRSALGTRRLNREKE